MKKEGKSSEEKINLRLQAEEKLAKRSVERDSNLIDADTIKLLHELEVHQIELEMQNEELQLAKEKAELATAELTELYDFASVGYFTFSPDGTIEKLNLHGANLLDSTRSTLLKRNFRTFVSANSQTTFNDFLKNVFDSGLTQNCEIRLNVPQNSELYVFLSGVISEDKTQCLANITDISKLKKTEKDLKSSYALLKIAGSTAKFGGWIHDLANNKGFWSEEVSNIHETPIGYVPDLKDGINFYAPEWRETITIAAVECATNGTPYDLELELITAKNNRIWVRTLGEAVRNKSGQITKIRGSIQDITEHKLALESLRLSEEKFRHLYENMAQGVFYQRADGQLIDINPEGLKMLGLTRDQFLGRTSYHPDWKVVDEQYNILSAEQHPSMLGLKKAINIEKVVGVFNPLQQKYKWLSLNVKPQFKPGDDKPYQVFVTMHDITDRKIQESINSARLHLVHYAQTHSLDELLEETLNEAEKLTGSQIGFFHFVDNNQEDLKLQNWSTKTKALFCKAEEIDSHYPISKAGVWVDCLKERKSVIHNDYASLPHRKGMPEGHAEVIRELVVPITRGDKIKGIIGVGNKATNYIQQDIDAISTLADQAWEITELKKAEGELIESEARFRSTFDQSPVGTAIVSTDKHILGCNESLCRFLGYTENELIGKTISEITFPEDRDIGMEILKLQLEGKAVSSTVQKRYLNKNGKAVWGEVSINLVRDQMNKPLYFLPIIQDITERKKRDEELIESEAQLRELNATKDKFFSIIAHDLKNPFNAIMGFSNLLEDHILEKDYERIDKYVTYIKGATQTAVDLLGNLLEWSRSQTGRMEFNPDFVEMVDLINEVADFINLSAAQKSIQITRKLPRVAPAIVDREMISTVLRNLLSNAVKFTRIGGEIVISIEQTDKELLVTVADNGVGLNKEAMNKLFRIDQSYSTKGTNHETGTGLGLILCKEFVEKHGGKIWVESEVNMGSFFYFTIPLNKSST